MQRFGAVHAAVVAERARLGKSTPWPWKAASPRRQLIEYERLRIVGQRRRRGVLRQQVQQRRRRKLQLPRPHWGAAARGGGAARRRAQS